MQLNCNKKNYRANFEKIHCNSRMLRKKYNKRLQQNYNSRKYNKKSNHSKNNYNNKSYNTNNNRKNVNIKNLE